MIRQTRTNIHKTQDARPSVQKPRSAPSFSPTEVSQKEHRKARSGGSSIERGRQSQYSRKFSREGAPKEFTRHRTTELRQRPGDEPVKFIGLGGFEEVGRNLMLFEYKNEIVIVDMGLQFPEEDTPGIDY
ncbi:hypothetical protein HY227_00940, partial [Candidatus Wolfebacteria bacterium]|nr:hypothetical protein [Candidatus Wolfebacteria bacterium]